MKKNKRSKTTLPDKKNFKAQKGVSESRKQVVSVPIIVAFAMFFVNLLFIPDAADLLFLDLNKFLFYAINLLFTGIVYYSLAKKKYSEKTGKYVFLFLLILIIISGFFRISDDASKETINFYEQIAAFKTFLVIPLSILGSIVIRQHKEKLINLVNDLFKNKKEKYIPFSKKELPFTVILFIIIAISVFTLFYHLSYFDLYSDEAQVTQGAAGYYHTGKYEFWDFVKDKSTGIKYDRAKPHLFTVAQSYKLFGVNTWSSRFPSVVFGLIMIILSYYVARYFIRDRLSVVLITFSFAFYFEFLFLQRWARMYAMLLPAFLLLFYTAYRFFTEPLPEKYKKFKENSFFSIYLDFNYLLLPGLLILFVLNLSLHINSAIIMAVFFIFIIFSIFLFKEKKYIVLTVAGILIFLSQILFPSLFSYRPLTFFEADNFAIYSRYFFSYPIDSYASIIIILIGFTVLIVAKNKNMTQKYLSLYIVIIFSWLFFSFIIKFASSFRYMSFLAPLVIFAITGMLFLIVKSLYGKIIQTIILILIVASVLTQFLWRYDDLYVRNFASPAKPSIAWRKIINNYHKGEIIFRHWGPMMYFDDLDSTATVRTIGSGKKKKMLLNVLLDSLKNYKSGWLTWNTYNSHALDPLIPDYCDIYFDKISGYGIDKSGVEIFYYTDSMLKNLNAFYGVRYMPFANLNTANDFAIFFEVKAREETDKPFYFRDKKHESISFLLYPDRKNSLTISLQPEKIVLKSNTDLSDNRHYIVFTKNEHEATLFIDGKLADKKTLKNNLNEIVKFKINPYFRGQINDIRIYGIALNQKQIKNIINDKGNVGLSEINEKKYKTLFHWQKK